MAQTTIRIEGMTCGHCVATVKGALSSVAGVESVDVDLSTGTAVVDGEADAAAVRSAVEDAGYEVAS